MPSLVQRVRRRASEELRRRSTRELRQPSFTYKQLEARRVRRAMHELGCKDPAYLIDGKLDTYAWARGRGFRVPALLGSHADVRDIAWDELADRCVVKPYRGTSGVGVYLLERHGTSWRELHTARELDGRTVADELVALADAGTVSREVMVEELVRDPRAPGKAPVDFKVSTFFGRVGMIEAKAHDWDARAGAIATWRIFDAQWRDLGNPFNDYRTDPTIQPPVHADALLDLARRVSEAVPRPYLRVDLFEDADGPVLGEVTPEPGGDVIVRPDVDRMLGRLWEEAETRLRVRAAGLGVLTPAGLPGALSRSGEPGPAEPDAEVGS